MTNRFCQKKTLLENFGFDSEKEKENIKKEKEE